jgi:hypothetical protein
VGGTQCSATHTPNQWYAHNAQEAGGGCLATKHVSFPPLPSLPLPLLAPPPPFPSPPQALSQMGVELKRFQHLLSYLSFAASLINAEGGAERGSCVCV